MKATRLLMIVALAGALLSAGCLGAAYSLATNNDSRSTQIITRDLPWDGATALYVDMPARVRYVQAPGPGRLTARGPHRSVSTLLIDSGRVHDQLLRTGAVIEITLTAPDVSSFHVNGQSRFVIENFDQPVLRIEAQGGAIVDASGRAKDVFVSAQGGGAINLTNLSVGAVHGSIDGASTLVAAPSENADLDVGPLAVFILLSRPAHLSPYLQNERRVIHANQGS